LGIDTLSDDVADALWVLEAAKLGVNADASKKRPMFVREKKRKSELF